MAADSRLTQRRVCCALVLLVGGLLLQARPAFAYKQDSLPGSYTLKADGLMRTVTGVYFSNVTLSVGQQKNFDGRLEVDGPSAYQAQVLVAAVVNCYTGSYSGTGWSTGSLGGVNWTTTGPTADQNVAVRVHHLFTAPSTATYTCRLGIRMAVTSSAATNYGIPTMTVIGGSTHTWLRMSDQTLTPPVVGSTWSHSTDSFIGPNSNESKTATILLNPSFGAGPMTAGGIVNVWADAYLTTCYTDDDCPGHKSSGTTNGSKLDSTLIVTRLDSGGVSCGLVTTADGTTALAQTPTRNHAVPHYTHHLKIDHYLAASNSSAAWPACSNRFRIELRLTWTYGNPIRIEGGSTSQREYCSAADKSTCPTHGYLQTLAYAAPA